MVLSTFVDTADYRQAAGGKICALHIFFYESRVRVPARLAKIQYTGIL